ncbi:Uncharacterised protein [Kluyvera cryocrescens]|uniref:Uncharacterized protein n=1 Tax=Kluyvera cryocrescens TaxID=580 RepID=A0A485D5B2_KLUCR|nr:Uncharacterised protein [Kluyvera cryocrescens]
MRGSTLISASTSEFATDARLTPRRVPAVGFNRVTSVITCSPRVIGLIRVTMFSLIFSMIFLFKFRCQDTRPAMLTGAENYRPILSRCASSMSTPFTFSMRFTVSISTSSEPFIVSLK